MEHRKSPMSEVQKAVGFNDVRWWAGHTYHSYELSKQHNLHANITINRAIIKLPIIVFNEIIVTNKEAI
jgi:hypothetical protein